MKTDRELLEMAAKAAWMPIHVWGAKGREQIADMSDPSNHKIWDPLNDDGDAFRLLARFRFVLEFDNTGAEDDCAYAHYPSGRAISGMFDAPINGDAARAGRRVIVLAAAAIGEAM